jgi:hypothetical protein
VQLIRPYGSRCSGAEAVLEITAPHNWAVHLLWLAYQRNTTIRSAFEATYRFVAVQRAKIPCSTEKIWVGVLNIKRAAWFAHRLQMARRARGVLGTRGVVAKLFSLGSSLWLTLL